MSADTITTPSGPRWWGREDESMADKALRQPMTQERLDRLAAGPWSYAGEPLKHPERAILTIRGADLFDLIEAVRISREALTELAGIQDRDGWTQNMGARVALHKLDGLL